MSVGYSAYEKWQSLKINAYFTDTMGRNILPKGGEKIFITPIPFTTGRILNNEKF